MAKKKTESKKVESVNIPRVEFNYILPDGRALTLSCKKYMSVADVGGFANTVVESLFDEDGSYHPYKRDISFNVALLIYFTDIDNDMTVDEYWGVICETTVLQDIIDVVGYRTYDILYSGVDREINIREADIINRKQNELYDAMTSLVDSTLDGKIGEYLTKILSTASAYMNVETVKKDSKAVKVKPKEVEPDIITDFMDKTRYVVKE